MWVPITEKEMDSIAENIEGTYIGYNKNLNTSLKMHLIADTNMKIIENPNEEEKLIRWLEDVAGIDLVKLRQDVVEHN